MTDASLAKFFRPGFDPIFDEGELRLRYAMPRELRGRLSAELLCRGELLDGTEGVPSRIVKRLGEELDGDSLVAPWQVHGTAVLEGRPIWVFPQRPKADGVLLDPVFDPDGRTRGSLRFADCAPVLVASSYPRPWALLLHSGFKGTLLGIFPAAWQKVRSHYGELDPRRTYAWVGPMVGPCCYTRKLTDPLARRAMEKWERFVSPTGDGFVRLDLPHVIEEQAKDAGLPGENIYLMDLCTCCNSSYFYSYRSGDLDDRMMLIAKLV